MDQAIRKSALVFLPDSLQLNSVGFLEGFSGLCEDTQAFFVLSKKLKNSSADSIGYVSEVTPENGKVNNCRNTVEWLHINGNTGEMKICGSDSDVEYCVTCIRYDYRLFVESEAVLFGNKKYGVYFETLVKSLKNKCLKKYREKRKTVYGLIVFIFKLFGIVTNFCSEILDAVSPLIKYSAILKQLQINLTISQWLMESLEREKRITLKIGNAIVTKIADFILGLIVLYLFFEHEQEILVFIRDITETIIQGIKQLLIILMGSPVGLKLNYAFSQNLGKFFLYHITLWETFLMVTKHMIKYALRLLIIPGAFGLTYQTALISDLVSFATFHVYCIYVYAARLYGLQIKGIVSLSKLFVGRKFNPLRNRVDSLQYTHNQLFIGTLGFTILLFLLPTILLYYSVFTILRLAVHFIETLLLCVRHLLQCLPIYVIVLWLKSSPKMAGNIHLELSEGEDTLRASLKLLSLSDGIAKCCPDVVPNFPEILWGKLIRGILTGVLF